MTGPRIIFVPLVLVMVAWAGYVGWLSRQAAMGSASADSDRPTHVQRIDAAISQAEREMTSDRR
jgi:hypothetical protein